MIGERLQEIRKDKGMKQQELAELLGVSLTTVSGYENDTSNPNDDVKVEIARIFNISLDYLLGATDDYINLSRDNIIVLDKDYPQAAIPEVMEYAKYQRTRHSK